MAPFFEDTLRDYSGAVHSLHIVGSAVTPDFREKSSVVHSVIVLENMDFAFLRFLASLGKKYARKGIAAPLVMTPVYIRESLDVFPIEFHDFRLIHRTVAGEDIFSGLSIGKEYLRLQCEREIKVRLIGLRQNYISTLGDKGRLADIFSESIVGCMPLLRAVVFLLGKEPPVGRHNAVSVFQEMTSIEAGVFEKLLMLRAGAIKPSGDELNTIFEEYYAVLERMGGLVDEFVP